MNTYSLDLAFLTVLRTDANGEVFDLNASGDPCADLADLRSFVSDLFGQGAFDAATRDELLAAAE